MTGIKTILTRLNAIALAAMFALVLAGCGGGGTAEEPPPMPTPQEMCESDGGRYNADGSCTSAADLAAEAEAKALMDAKNAAMTAYTDAKSALDAVADISDSDSGSYALAMHYADKAKEASDAAQAATTSEAAQAAQADAEEARDEAVMYAGMVSTAKTDADEKATAAAAKKKENDEAQSREDAIGNEATQDTDDGPGGADATTDHTIAISYKDGGASVEITVAGAAAADPKFAMMDGKYVRDDGEGVTETVVVHTDIEAPKATPFKDVHMLDANPDTENNNRSLAIKDENAGNAALSDSKVTLPAPGGGVTLGGADDADTEDVKENEYSGTFDGAPGTFTCTEDKVGCTVTVVDGKITKMGANVYFTPDKGATVDVPDDDYLYYGYWEKKTTDDDKDVTTYNEVQTFAGSSLDAATNVASVEGTASYAGGAAGVYARNVFTSDGEIDTTTSGTFTADVSLMAYFGGDDVAANKHDSIEGTIDGFVLSGDENAGAWSVAVAATSISNTFTGTAKGGAGDGSFSGAFHGDDTDDDDNAIAPQVLVGEFNAGFSNGSVAGAYGARRK